MRQPMESFLSVDLKARENKAKHHTDDLSEDALIVRRGQGFSIRLNFNDSYDPSDITLTFAASTGSAPDESRGTSSVFWTSDAEISAEAKAVWRAEVDLKDSSPEGGSVAVTITPPADAPVGKYSLSLLQNRSSSELGTVTVLFNPWCPEDSVYMEEEAERQEYVMNDSGLIYTGSGHYISPRHWDFGQFEEDMVEICLQLLKVNPKHKEDAAMDEASYCDPIYVGRVISAMVNRNDDLGVVVGRWSGSYSDGTNPSHWSGSYPILKRWHKSRCRPVKYGQCWVFAGVMCSVMRLLGVPCRVVTNFSSAHDTNQNLTIDVYHAAPGAREPPSADSVWNFHVWVEAWMKRPDLPSGFDGWQVLDPTPQERSDGVFCCGPAPVRAILNGLTHLEYDIPFVFAEVNADRIDWLVKADGSKKKIWTDARSVGQNISTKSVGSRKRNDVTDSYKFKEGTSMERAVFKYAAYLNKHKDYLGDAVSRSAPVNNGRGAEWCGTGDDRAAPTDRITVCEPFCGDPDTDRAFVPDPTDRIMICEPFCGAPEPTVCLLPDTNTITVERVETNPEIPEISVKFEELSTPVNGQDVKLNLVLHSEATEPRALSINISVRAKSYDGSAHSHIQSQLKEETLLPGKELCVPVLVPFSQYWKPMLDHDAMNVCALVSDAGDDSDSDSEVYLAVDDVVLLDPHMELKALSEAWVKQQLLVEMAFANPVCETLRGCTLTVSGGGLLHEEQDISLPDLGPGRRVRMKLCLFPYKAGQKTLVVNFNSSVFRDIKTTLPVHVQGSCIHF